MNASGPVYSHFQLEADAQFLACECTEAGSEQVGELLLESQPEPLPFRLNDLIVG